MASSVKMSKLICFGVLQLFGFSLINGVTFETTNPSIMTTLTPSIANITISPSIKVNYTVEVSTSGPAVLNSIMVFKAQVYLEPNHTLPTERLRFLWLNTADQSQEYTYGQRSTELHKTFSQYVKPGQFVMVAVVSTADHPDIVLTYASTVFTLTRKLNGKLKVKQDLDYQRLNTTFAIDRPIRFHLNMTDHFSHKDAPKFSYYWYNGSELIHMTPVPLLERNFSQPDIMHLQAIASAVFSPDPLWPLLAPLPHIPDKTGSFVEKLHFKESLSGCNFSRMESSAEDQSLKLGSPLLLNITCLGSFPSAVCWNITQQNMTLNGTCKPASGQFANSTQHNMSVTIGSTGWHTVHLAVYNDVSFELMSRDYYVYDPDSVNIPALVLPVVFIVLGGVILAVGATYIVRLRRKAHVEVADFDFEPSISVRRTGSLSAVVPAIKQFFRSRGRSSSSLFNTYNVPSRPQGIYETL